MAEMGRLPTSELFAERLGVEGPRCLKPPGRFHLLASIVLKLSSDENALGAAAAEWGGLCNSDWPLVVCEFCSCSTVMTWTVPSSRPKLNPEKPLQSLSCALLNLGDTGKLSCFEERGELSKEMSWCCVLISGISLEGFVLSEWLFGIPLGTGGRGQSGGSDSMLPMLIARDLSALP